MPRTVPTWSFLLPEVVHQRRFHRGLLREAVRAPRVLHLTHRKCLDGTSCDVLLRIAREGVATWGLDPHQTLEALDLVSRVPGRGRDLVVSDLSFQRGEGPAVRVQLARLRDAGWLVTWRDHHHKQWEGTDLAALRKTGAAVTLDTTGTRCGTGLVQQDLLPDDAFARRLAGAVCDHDLWIREDPWSGILSDAVVAMGNESFRDHLLATRNVEDPELRQVAEEHRAEKDRAVAWGVEHARFVEGEAGARVALVYGDVPTNEVLHALYEDHGAQVGVLLKPEGVFSLRSREDVPVCHLVAQRWGGGGHPNASGGTLSLSRLDLPSYWLLKTRHPRSRELARDALDAVAAHLRGELTASEDAGA